MTDEAVVIERVKRDPGLQRERSQLAWTRTSLAIATAVVLLLKLSVLPTLGMLALLGVAWMTLNACANRKDLIATKVSVVGRPEVLRKIGVSLFVVVASLIAFVSFIPT